MKTGYGLQVFRASSFSTKKRETTKTDKEPIKKPPGINQNHARIDQATSSLLRLYILARVFFIYLAFGNQEGIEYAIFQISTFVGYNCQRTVQVMVMLWKRHNK